MAHYGPQSRSSNVSLKATHDDIFQISNLLDSKMMSDRKAELERKKAKLQAIREEKERRRREKEQKDVRDEKDIFTRGMHTFTQCRCGSCMHLLVDYR